MRKIIIYGLGDRYKKALSLGLLDELNIVAYTDSNSKLWDMTTNGQKIISPEKIGEIDYDLIYVTSDIYYYEIRDMLIKKYNISYDKIKMLEYTNGQSVLTQRELLKKMDIFRKAIVEMRYKEFERENLLTVIEEFGEQKVSEIDNYWTGHTVWTFFFASAEESYEHTQKVFQMYPMFKEMYGIELNRDGQTVLDYGCGPGRDLINYSISNNLKGIIGIDVSHTSLKYSQYRLALHNIKNARLIHKDDNNYKIPLEDESVDFVNCQGVLMHLSNPDQILSEFCRVLKKESEQRFAASVMVYSKESIYYHLYVAYYLRFIDNTKLCDVKDVVEKDDVDDLFRCSTDGVNCPVAKCYERAEFTDMCLNSGFKEVEYMGAYFDTFEKKIAHKYLEMALADERLEECHKEFLRKVTFDKAGYAMNGDYYCGVHAVYRLYI